MQTLNLGLGYLLVRRVIAGDVVLLDRHTSAVLGPLDPVEGESAGLLVERLYGAISSDCGSEELSLVRAFLRGGSSCDRGGLPG